MLLLTIGLLLALVAGGPAGAGTVTGGGPGRLPDPVAGAPDATPAAALHLDWEREIGPDLEARPFPWDQAFDPIVATHPTDPRRIAVLYHREAHASGSCSPLMTALRVTHDGGAHWREAAGLPWAGSGRAPNWHGVLAWGPGPGGRDRLYWADTTVPGCTFTAHRLSIAWSDDEGDHWSRMWLERASTATPDGGYPDITVDRDPASPNHGVVYAAINWFPHGHEPHLRVVASRDLGRTWTGAEVPPLPAPARAPFAYRIGYRLAAAPDGGLYVTFHQSDRPRPVGISRREAFGIARLRYHRADRTFDVGAPQLVRELSANAWVQGAPAPGTTDDNRLRPRWTHGLDVDPRTGAVLVAVADWSPGPRPRGRVFVGRSTDQGRTWSWTRVPDLPRVDGRTQSAHKPALVIGDGFVFIGLHGLVDVPFGTSPRRGLATIGDYWTVATDGGRTFAAPRAISPQRWDPEALAVAGNRAGLRDRAALTTDGAVVYAYATGRSARPAPSREAGHSTIHLARFSVP